MMAENPIAPAFLPARLVAARYAVTIRTLDRWTDDERLGFPAAVYLGRMRFWRIADLEAWEAEQASGAPRDGGASGDRRQLRARRGADQPGRADHSLPR